RSSAASGSGRSARSSGSIRTLGPGWPGRPRRRSYDLGVSEALALPDPEAVPAAIGASFLRKEDAPLLTGRARFADDVAPARAVPPAVAPRRNGSDGVEGALRPPRRGRCRHRRRPAGRPHPDAALLDGGNGAVPPAAARAGQGPLRGRAGRRRPRRLALH